MRCSNHEKAKSFSFDFKPSDGEDYFKKHLLIRFNSCRFVASILLLKK